MKLRSDYQVIVDTVPQGARVLDVGCGDGELLALLRDMRGATVRGMELSQDGVNASVGRGLPVVQGDADEELGLYPDDAFDVVVLSRTIQAMRRPSEVLGQMRRIGSKAIVSLPNFGHWRVGLSLLGRGRMPRTEVLPSRWHDTDNIHLCTLFDMAELAVDAGWVIDAVVPVRNGKIGARKRAVTALDNWRATDAVFVLRR